MERERESISTSHRITKKMILFGVIPFVVLGTMIMILAAYPEILFQNSLKALPDISIEKVEFLDNSIVAFVRNTGPAVVTIAQADVNDRIHPAAIEPSRTLPRLAAARVMIPFIWNVGEPYEVGITTDDGTRFSKKVDSAAPAPRPTVEQASTFALIGTYVGVIPIMVGLLWYPFIRKLSPNKYNFFLSLTLGLLVFLGIDALLEGNEIAINDISPTLNAQMLVIIVTIISLLSLLYISHRMMNRAAMKSEADTKYDGDVGKYSISTVETPTPNPATSSVASQYQLLVRPVAISMMISIGIGLHNFGEGLAIGAAVLLGKVALSSFLILGFTLHNTTEGLAIIAPMAKSRRIPITKLLIMGMIAGVPTILGAWIGGFLYSPIATIVFLSIGAGAIFQVVYSIGSWMYRTSSGGGIMNNTSILAGFAVGMLIMYLTGLLL